MKLPSVKSSFLAAIALAAFLAPSLAPSAEPKILRFAFQGELKSVDPYQINESFSLSVNGAVYEGLIRRGPDMRIEPCLATSWEMLDPLHWRFHLRKGVKFHEGRGFHRGRRHFLGASRARRRLGPQGPRSGRRRDREGRRLYRRFHPQDAESAADQRVGNLGHLFEELVGGAWRDGSHGDERDDAALRRAARQRHRPVHPRQPRARREDGLEARTRTGGTSRSEMSTRWCSRRSRMPRRASRRCFRGRSTGWIRCRSTIRRASTPIREPQVLAGPEIRTIFLGMDQFRDELGHSSVKGKNPFKDVRVRKAFYQAIDEDAINKKVMRGQATPSALMIAPSLFSLSKDFHRIPFDPEASKKLLAEAGYPDGFEVQMDCPNDRYVNDEQICQAVVGMLARVGVKVDLNAEPKSKFFAAISAAGGYDSLVLSAGLDADDARELQRIPIHHGLSRSEDQLGRQQRRRLLQSEGRRTRPQGAGGAGRGEARRHLQAGLADLAVRRRRLHPAASAGAGLGRVEDDACDPAPGQLLHLLVGHDGLRHRQAAAVLLTARQSRPRQRAGGGLAQSDPGEDRSGSSPMIAFILRRLLASIGVLIAVGLIAFAMFRYVGDPVNQMVGIETSAEREQLRHQLGLDQPVIVQACAFSAMRRVSISASPINSSSRSPI